MIQGSPIYTHHTTSSSLLASIHSSSLQLPTPLHFLLPFHLSPSSPHSPFISTLSPSFLFPPSHIPSLPSYPAHQVKLLLVYLCFPELDPAVVLDAALPRLFTKLSTCFISFRERRVQGTPTDFLRTNLIHRGNHLTYDVVTS